MSVVKINAITVEPERAEELIARFAARAGAVGGSEGFEAFELLKPTDDRNQFLVYTRWRSEEDFQAWMNSPAFGQGHKAHNKRGAGEHAVRALELRRCPARTSGLRQLTVPNDAVAKLTGPGGPFEIVVEDVARRPAPGVPPAAELDARPGRGRRRARRRRLGRAGRPPAHVRRAQRARAADRGRSARASGSVPGDRVAVLSANNLEWVVMFWACAVIGVACVPLNAWWKAEELEFGLSDSGAKVLICDPKRWAVVRDVVGCAPAARARLRDATSRRPTVGPSRPKRCSSRTIPDRSPVTSRTRTTSSRSSTRRARPASPRARRSRTARCSRTSRTSSCLGAIASARRAPSVGPREDLQTAYLLVVPLFHVTGCLSTMIPGYATGGKLVLMPPGKFDPDEAMAVIERERVTSIGGVPDHHVAHRRGRTFERYDLSSVSRIGYGGAPAAPELVERIRSRVPEPAQDALDRVRAHRDRVGRDVARRRRLLRAPELGRPRRADGRAPDHRSRRRVRSPLGRERRDLDARARRS